MSEFVYTTYIKSTPQKVWDAITTPEFCRQYWGHTNVSDWKPGSRWDMVNSEGGVQVTGQVLESNPPSRLVISWASPENASNKAEHSRVRFEIENVNGTVRLNVIHDELHAGSEMERGISKGWPLVLSGLKSYLETGQPFDIMAVKGPCAAPQAKVA